MKRCLLALALVLTGLVVLPSAFAPPSPAVLGATECQETRNPRNFRFMALEPPELTETADQGVWYGRLPSGYGFVRYYIEGNGIEPDEVVLQDLVELSLGIDSCIARAEEWLGSQ